MTLLGQALTVLARLIIENRPDEPLGPHLTRYGEHCSGILPDGEPCDVCDDCDHPLCGHDEGACERCDLDDGVCRS